MIQVLSDCMTSMRFEEQKHSNNDYNFSKEVPLSIKRKNSRLEKTICFREKSYLQLVNKVTHTHRHLGMFEWLAGNPNMPSSNGLIYYSTLIILLFIELNNKL